jgi:hypothetical protein
MLLLKKKQQQKWSAFINVFARTERICYCRTYDEIDRNYSKTELPLYWNGQSAVLRSRCVCIYTLSAVRQFSMFPVFCDILDVA